MRIKKSLNTILSTVKQRHFYLIKIYLLSLYLTSCAMGSGSLPPIVKESPVDSALVWKIFQEQYPSERLPYKMKINAKLRINAITRRFTIFSIGDAKGLVKMDILSSGIYLVKIAENPDYTIFHLPTLRKAYITNTQDSSDIEILIGFSLPFSLDTLSAFFTSNFPILFPSYSTAIPREGVIEYILPDKSQVILSYEGKLLQWQNSYGWKIVPMYDAQQKQYGITSYFLPKNYSIEYIIERSEDIGYIDPKSLTIVLPPDVQLYKIKD